MAIDEVTSASSTTLDQTSDTLINSMTLTPGAGDYLAVFMMNVDFGSAAPGNILTISIYVNNSPIAHTEREILANSSVDGNTNIAVVTQAHVSPGAGQTVEARYRVNTLTLTGIRRALTLFPKASADFSEASATGDTSTASNTYGLMDSMQLVNPPSGEYLAVFSTSGDGPANADLLDFAIFVGGSILAHTERTYEAEPSIKDSEQCILIAAQVSPNGSQNVEVHWKNGRAAATINAHERTLTLLKVASADISEATATADEADSSSTDEILAGMTLTTPGDEDWLALFSGGKFMGVLTSRNDIFVSIYENASQDVTTEYRSDHEASIDNADSPMFSAGKVAPGVGNIDVRWRGSTTVTRTARERTLVAIKEALLLPIPEGQVLTNLNLISVP